MPFKKLVKSFVKEVQAGAAQLQQQQQQQQQWQQPPMAYPSPGANGQLPSPSQANTPCPRQVPQAGYQDWIGLNDSRFQNFYVCPTCYNTSVRSTPYANSFVTKFVRPDVPLRCDMSRFWVKLAGMVLLTMNNNRRYDITLLPRVAGIAVRDGDCPNSQLEREQIPLPVVTRVWYTIRDPHTGAMPKPEWTICSCCLVNIQTLLPTIANEFGPVAANPINGSCALISSSRFDHERTVQMLRYMATSEVTSSMSGRGDMSVFIKWLNSNPPPMATVVQAPSGSTVQAPSTSTSAQSSSYAPRQETAGGLCPRDVPSTTLKCYSMKDLFDLTVCEKCFAEAIRPDADRGVELARRFDPTPSVRSSGFTCQLYSDRMRGVWQEAASSDNFSYVRQKVNERRAREREVQMKRAQLQQQARQLMQQAMMQEEMASISMSTEINRVSNNMLLSSVSHRVGDYTVTVPANFSESTHMNNQAAMLRMQAAQVEEQIRLDDEEWKRYWE